MSVGALLTDCLKIVNVARVMNSPVIHDPGVGQVGAGIANALIEWFHKALQAFPESSPSP